MDTLFGPRAVFALAVAGMVALACFLLSNDAEASLVVLVGAVAAVLIAADSGGLAPPRTQPREAYARRETPEISEVIEAVIEPILIVQDSRVAAANRAARKLLGAHILGEDVRLAIRHPAAAERLISPDDTAAHAPIHLVGLGTREQRWEMRIQSVGGRMRIVHLVDRTGSYATDRIRVDFVANASHELRTPLASLLGFIETLREGAGEEPETRERFLRVMFDEARRMRRLIDDLISLSRIEAEKYRVPDQSVDLGELIEEVRAEVAATASERGTEVTTEIADIAPVLGDRAQLSQVLHNIVGNAMKYGRAGTPITIVLRKVNESMVAIDVVDEGEGIPSDHLPRLTERFYRVDSGRSRTLGGTGLGLAIVKHIVERHRGRLDINSTVGRGTTVTVLLPA